MGLVRRNIWLALLGAGSSLLLATSAHAEIRTATASDPPEPTVVYDFERVGVAFDRDAGRLRVTMRFHSPLPESQPTYNSNSASVRLTSRVTSYGFCDTATTKGDTRIFVAWEDPAGDPPPGYYARSTVEYRQESVRQPVQLSADRREFAVDVDDPLLLQGAGLKCVAASSSGRSSYDPTQSGGGPSSDSVESTYFDGFGIPILVAPEDGHTFPGTPPVLEWQTGAAPETLRIFDEQASSWYSTGSDLPITPGPGKTGKYEYAVARTDGTTRVIFTAGFELDHKYSWGVKRSDETYQVSSSTPTFRIGAPPVQSLAVTALRKQGSSYKRPGYTSFTLRSAPLAAYELVVTRGKSRVLRKTGKLSANAGTAGKFVHRWSCRSPGTYRWTATVIDEYGGQRAKHGSYSVSGRRCAHMRPKPKKPRRRSSGGGSRRACDPSYPTVCIPPPPPDLDCGDISQHDFRVRGRDPHRFDGNDDGIGCES
jgi:hypothetical protein